MFLQRATEAGYRFYLAGSRGPTPYPKQHETGAFTDANTQRVGRFEENKKEIKGFSREAMDALLRHPSPGNVRELENAIERAVVMARGDVLGIHDLPEGMVGVDKIEQRTASAGSLPDRLESMEQEAIKEAMEKAKGVQSQAARLLGINERNLRYKLKKYGLKE